LQSTPVDPEDEPNRGPRQEDEGVMVDIEVEMLGILPAVLEEREDYREDR